MLVLPDLTDLTKLIDSTGPLPYVILLVWTFLEGETIVIIAGFCAQDGTPNLLLVILCAFCGSLCSDQLMFFLGRYKGKGFIAKRPFWQLRAEKVYRILERHQTWLILGFRFLYGLRNITPFSIGMSEVRTKRFVILNVIGAALWATTFATAGYLFGKAAESFLDTREQKSTVILGLLGLVVVIWIIRQIRRGLVARKLQAAQAAAALEAPEANTTFDSPSQKLSGEMKP
jgi:membrane protein DedA with SNARE-associated domain